MSYFSVPWIEATSILSNLFLVVGTAAASYIHTTIEVFPARVDGVCIPHVAGRAATGYILLWADRTEVRVRMKDMETTVISEPSPQHSFAVPEYLHLYEWEKFDYHQWQEWMGQNWVYSVYFTVIYVTLILSGRIWMKNRQPYKLKGPLIFWNVVLATFSILGFWRTLPELLYLLGEPNGFHATCCLRERLNIGTIFWTLVITFSKVVELGDTIFIVLRKQPLIFLHWYHHATVMLYCWYTYYHHDPGHRWFMTMNFLVHSIMYSYYALRAMGIKLPIKMAMMITSLQLLQMIIGVTVGVYSLQAKRDGGECQSQTFNIYLALSMYASYLVLFANFFYKVYLQKKKTKDA